MSSLTLILSSFNCLNVRYVREEGRWLYYSSFGVSLACIITLACCSGVRRNYPVNLVFLGIFTVCEGLLLGTISSYYDVDAVLIAVGTTAGVSLGLTIFALQTKIDFTACWGDLSNHHSAHF